MSPQQHRTTSIRSTVGVFGAGEADAPWSVHSRKGTSVTSPTVSDTVLEAVTFTNRRRFYSD